MKNLSYLLGLFVVILGFTAFNLYDKNNELERAVHATYTRDLSAATEKLSLLHSTVSQSLLFQDKEALSTELDSIWRMSSELRKSVANLPLQPEVQNEWMRYLGKIGDTAKKTATTGDIEDWQQSMKVVSSNLQAFAEEWNVATVAFFQNDGDFKKWTTNKTTDLNASPFVQASKQLKTYNETDFPLTASESDFEKKRDLQHLKDKLVTKKEAIEKFKAYFPEINEAVVTVTKSSDDAPYPFYHIQFIRGSRVGYADITENGGHLLSFLVERPVLKNVLSHEEIFKSAEQFMKKVGYEDVVISESRENHESWHYVFTRIVGEDKALVYPDSIQVKVAKDTGEILGVNALEYIQKETIPQQSSMPISWGDFFADHVVVDHVKPMYTANGDLQLRKCFEVIVRMDNDLRDTFRVVVDAESHEVLKTEKLL